MVSIQDVLSRAVQAHQTGRVEVALPLYRLILAVDPGQPDSLHLSGLILRQKGRGGEAASLMDRSLRVNATLASRHADLGGTLADLGRFEPAAAAFRHSLDRRPEQPALFLSLGEALRRLGRAGEAGEALKRAIALQPDLADAWYGLGAIVQSDGSLMMAAANGQAARLFERTAILAPESVLAWVNLGIVSYVIGRLEKAEAACRVALAVQPGFDRALLRLGQARLARGALAQALPVLRRAAVRSPDDAEAGAVLDRAERYRRIAAAAEEAALPAGLAIRGTFRNTSGYAFMVRQFVRCLDARGVPLQLMDVPVSFLKAMDDGQRDPFFDRFDQPVRARAMLNCMIPNLAERIPGIAGILFSMSETRTVPPDWVAYSRRQDHVIVPTPSSAAAWIDAGHPQERVHLCPLGVDPRRPASEVAPMVVTDGQGRRLSDYRVRIANVSDLTLRKNLDGLLRVWLRTTGPQDDAALLLKLGKGSPGEAAQIAGFLGSVAASCGKGVTDAAPVFVVSGLYSDEEMTSLMAAATHYWSMSHGEGWDLPMTQAGAMGLTLIAPRHSAYTAYLDDEVALMLSARPSPGRPPYAGLEWWTPDEDAAAEALSRVIRDGLTPPSSARDRLAARFTWEQAGDRLIEVLRGIGALG